jgi:hypothetical protein
MKFIYKDGDIVEMSTEEYKELFRSTVKSKELPINIPKMSVQPIKDSSDKLKNGKGRPQVITNEQIKQIKALAKEGLNNQDIAKRLNIRPQDVVYWRLNTPKNINE